jgi:hypothetical protein
MSLQHTCQKLHVRHIFVYFLLRSWIFCLTIWITSTRCMVLKASPLIVVVGTKTTPVTIAARRLPGQKNLLYSALMIISHSSFSHLWFLSPALDSLAMEDKRGTKCPHFPSAEGCPLPSDAKTPPSVTSGSQPPPESPSEITSCRPRSSVIEQGCPSRNIIVIELSSSSDEEDFFVDTAPDAEFTRRLFGNLNRDLLRPPNDDKVIVLSDFDEEEEAR